MALNPAEVGRRYGQSINDFETAAQNTVEDIVINWSNEGMSIMQKIIRRKARTKGAATLAQDMYVKPLSITKNLVHVAVFSGSDYYDFVDKGVRGVKKNKAPGSPYKFKTLGAGQKMVASFKQYIAATGTTRLKGKQLIRKNKKTQGQLIDQAAKTMAVWTKIGGIKPMKFIAAATNEKRIKQLSSDLSKALGATIKASILK